MASDGHKGFLGAFLLGEADDNVVGMLLYLSQLRSKFDLTAVLLQMLSQNRFGALLCEVNTVRLWFGTGR